VYNFQKDVWESELVFSFFLDIIIGVLVSFQDTRQTGEWFRIFTRQVRKQLAQNIERVSEREQKKLARGRFHSQPVCLSLFRRLCVSL
jgi:hypothetical protein